jgi:hypothetical protein
MQKSCCEVLFVCHLEVGKNFGLDKLFLTLAKTVMQPMSITPVQGICRLLFFVNWHIIVHVYGAKV